MDGVCPPVRPDDVAVPFERLAPTVFHAEWWLNTVTDGDWNETVVRNGDRIVGRFPYVMTPLGGGQRLCTMPPLTHFLGPAVDEGAGAPSNRALKRAQITRQLIEALPPHSGFYHKFSRDISDTLLFQELGFVSGVQFTFEIAPADEAALWSRMRDKTRNAIRRAGETLTVSACADVEEFTSAYTKHIRQRGLRNEYAPALLNRVCGAALARGQGQILAARPASGGDISAAIFCVSDAVSTYYLLTTRALDAGNGAVALLLWQAILDSTARGLIFDFDGVNNEGSRLFFTGFGGTVAPRFTATRYTAAHKLAHKLLLPLSRLRVVAR